MRALGPLSSEWSWPRRGLSSGSMDDVFEDFDRLVTALSRPTFASATGFQPSCDVTEGKGHYLISFDMPGVKKEDIKIEVQGNQLVISGERQREMKSDTESSLRHERIYGNFARTFALPNSVHADKIEAHYEDGVLNVVLPKADSAKGRTIQVQTGQDGFFGRLLGSKKDAAKELKDVKVS